MAGFRYPQFCPIARAAEILGQRWTLLILRELFVGPQRFSDLRRRLTGVSPSVLAQRLAELESRGIVEQRELPPPAASQVYELGEAGRALWPALRELLRWGTRFLLPPVPDDHIEPDWVPVGLAAMVRSGAGPECRIEVRVRDASRDDVVCRVVSGRDGVRVLPGPGTADAHLRAEPLQVLGLATGLLRAADLARAGAIEVEGDVAALDALPELFQTDSGFGDAAGSESAPAFTALTSPPTGKD